jgi:hypothetical protein
MNDALLDEIKRAHADNPGAMFSLFTTSGHVLTGRIGKVAGAVTLQTGKEFAVVPCSQIEAFSCRPED